MPILGTIGLGLVWGWLAARSIYGARWTALVFVALGLAAQGLLVPQVVVSQAVPWFVGAGVVSFAVCLGWLRALRRRAV
jgi:hypothetical protein